jgi:hypothetical protein
MENKRMIREAEPKDKKAIQYLYKILSPEAPVKVSTERIEEIKLECPLEKPVKNPPRLTLPPTPEL